MTISKYFINEVEVITLENDYLKCDVVPSLGGKILTLFNNALKHSFLWNNPHLTLSAMSPGADYDTNFLGGIDELLPNDIPEQIDGIDYPDHGELWTAPLDYSITDETLIVSGLLPLSGLFYSKSIRLDKGSPNLILTYEIRNESGSVRHFLWKLHAALDIEKDDRLLTPAGMAKVVDPVYSRFSDSAAFKWPYIEGTDAAIVPQKNNTMDFFYLYDTPQGEMGFLKYSNNYTFGCHYDRAVFPYQWYFASYGGFLDHYTAILEPCTTMPISVNDASKINQCTVLQPGETIQTTVRIYAGETKSGK